MKNFRLLIANSYYGNGIYLGLRSGENVNRSVIAKNKDEFFSLMDELVFQLQDEMPDFFEIKENRLPPGAERELRLQNLLAQLEGIWALFDHEPNSPVFKELFEAYKAFTQAEGKA